MKREVSTLISEVLSGEMPVLALRGADEFAREGGDLDFMVPPGKSVAACGVVAKAAHKNGWFLAGYRNIGYLAQIVLIRPVPGGSDDAIKVDFFDGLRWYGVGTDVAGSRIFESLVSYQEQAAKLAGAAGFFQKILIVGRESERDWARVVAAGADIAYLTKIARELGLPLTHTQIEARGVLGFAKWRLRASSGGVSGPFSALIWFFRTAVAHFKFKLGAGTGMGLVLGISGLDGSGKSTLVDRLMAAYRKAGGEQPKLVHLLPYWIPLPHQILRRRKTQANYTSPYSEPPVSSWLNGGLRLSYYLTAFSLARASLWIGMKRGRLIILDRSFLDFSSDLTRARIPALRLPSWVLRMLRPAASLFYLDASPETAVARKGELTLAKASSLRTSYLNTCDTVRATLLDGNDAPDAVFKELLAHISMEYLRRIERAALRK
jgi:thymidylate kinase